jgi:NADH-quinone oxidoreductase subunit N
VSNLDIFAIGPEVVVTIAVVVILLSEVGWKPGAPVWGWLAAFGVGGAGTLSVAQWLAGRGGDAELYFSDMVVVDGFAAFAGMVIYVLTGLALLGGWDLITRLGSRGAEFVALVLLAATGMHLMAASANLIMLFIGLEVASISLYVLAGFTRDRVDADEASLKYFLLGAFASAVFLYGVALFFAATGTVSIYEAEQFLGGVILLKPGLLLAGIALLLVGLGFKVSSAPFHVWSPDVYQGAPGGITGFLSAGAKVAGFAALARVLVVPLDTYIDDWAPALAVLAVVSVVVGTLFAIAQNDIKRMLAYSSVAHAGFISMALLAGDAGVGDMWFYVATYAVQVIGAFTVASLISGPTAGRSPLADYAGLGKRSPWLAATMTLMMLAMAGIPLTAGFAGKAAVFRAAIDADYLWVVILAVIATVAGLFFYLRVIVLMYMEPGPEPADAPGVGWGARITLFVASAATVVFGVAPWPLLDVVRDAIPL